MFKITKIRNTMYMDGYAFLFICYCYTVKFIYRMNKTYCKFRLLPYILYTYTNVKYLLVLLLT